MEKTKLADRLRPWETALLLALCVTLLIGVRGTAAQRALSEKVIRLHIVAVSDAEADQAVKLRVRDAVLSRLTPILEDAADLSQAQETLAALLPVIEATARAVSGEERVSVTLGRETYPTRRYDGFALPAGEYTSLRVVLGEGAGRNWWCVVYPPLCALSVTEAEDAAKLLEEEDLRLITEDGPGYVVKFRAAELFGRLFD